MRRFGIFLTGCFGMMSHLANAADFSRNNLVIAHRGASGYLPEHTLPSAAMAHAFGVDYIEQDLVLTKDDQLIIMHDLTLEDTTNIEEIFPGRARKDGKWYAIDFTLVEIRTLSVHERTKDDKGNLYFPNRFPYKSSNFTVPTFREIVELIQGLNQSTGRHTGIYPELKHPEFHFAEGKDLLKPFVEELRRFNYLERNGGAIVQCFDPASLKRLRREFKIKLPLVQLLESSTGKDAGNDASAAMQTEKGLAEVATYADGIGPAISDLFLPDQLKLSPLLANAKKNKLVIHAYVLRADKLPPGVTFDGIAKILYGAGVQGLFTDQSDLLLAVIRNETRP